MEDSLTLPKFIYIYFFAIGEDEADILKSLATDLVCLDIGTGAGRSALAMAQTASHVVSVDPIDNLYELYRRDNVEYLQIPFKELDLGAYSFDLAFVDHFGPRTDAACSLLEAGVSTVVIDDIHMEPRIEPLEVIEERLYAAGAQNITYYDVGYGMLKATL